MDELIRDILAPGGAVARSLGEHFEPRPEQLEMALAVGRAMQARSHLLAEAGTGVGKSFAYLVPAMVRCLAHGEIVVVATNTISLQEQLVQKDVPVLREIVEAELGARGLVPAGRALKPVLVKGRGNYVSIRRLKQASSRQERLFADPAARRSLHAIEDWAYDTRDGTLSTLPVLERPGVWDKVQSDSGNCMGRKCPTYEACFYQRARREMEAANLLICNHALFFADMELRAGEAGFLPAYQHVVLDEAHNAEDNAANQFGLSLSEGRVFHLLTTLYQARQHKGYLAHLSGASRDAAAVDRAIHLVLEAEPEARAFFESLDEAAARSGSGRVRTPGVVENTLSPVMQRLSVQLSTLKDVVEGEPDKFELNAYAIRAAEIAAEAQAWLEQAQGAYAYWLEGAGEDEEAAGRAPRRRLTLAASPVDVAPLLRERLFAGNCSVTLTSATLATGRKARSEGPRDPGPFAHAVKRLGCEGAGTLVLGSPFDYATQAEFYVDLSVPDPRETPAGKRADAPGSPRQAQQRYLDALSRRVLHHVRATGGGAFVLFTSFATLRAVAERIADDLEADGMPLLAQGQTGPRGQLLQRFRESERSVLLGAVSFWEGVDVRGRGLRNVIITKLPFEPPDRPLTEARGELIRLQGGNPFMDDALPRAVLRFKQGFGRLIRSASDSGRVAVLDGRIVKTRYGKLFLDALPAGMEPRIIEATEEAGAPPGDEWL